MTRSATPARPEVGQTTTVNGEQAIITAVYAREYAIDVRTVSGREWRVSGLYWIPERPDRGTQTDKDREWDRQASK